MFFKSIWTWRAFHRIFSEIEDTKTIYTHEKKNVHQALDHKQKYHSIVCSIFINYISI
jgi:hypothetical protein